jgi:hypothetical protein
MYDTLYLLCVAEAPPTKFSTMPNKYTQLREEGLANFELLLNFWGIKYNKITPYEYDFLSPNRKDKNYGACRFNVQKGIGSDFAANKFDPRELKRFGIGFSEDDFAGYNAESNNGFNKGFDIIGLCQRANKVANYHDAADLLKSHLKKIASSNEFVKITEEYIKTKELERIKRIAINKEKAEKIWSVHKNIKGTLGEQYLLDRGIEISDEPNVGFHPKVYHPELKKFIPALLLAIRSSPDGELCGTHRIFIEETNFKVTKVKGVEAKLVVGPISGNGIWFGVPGPELYLAEGPESALDVRNFGASFVVSAISGMNFHQLTIPKYVKTLILCHDNDKAGQASVVRAIKSYRRSGLEIETAVSENIKDWNDFT